MIHHFLENSADLFPDKEAVVHGNNRYSYIEIENQSNRLANWLIDIGISKSDRVAILLRNSFEYIITYYAILKTGAIAVPLNTGLDVKEMLQTLEDCSPEILVSEKYFNKMIKNIFKHDSNLCKFLLISDALKTEEDIGKTKIMLFFDIFKKYSTQRPFIKLIDLDIASIIYTSGSTGKPKGVVLSHLNIVTNTRSIVEYLELQKHDRCMAILPFYYVYGKTLLNIHFSVSGTVVIDNRFTFPNAVLKTMIEEKVTGFSGVPSTFSILMNHSSIGKMEFPDLRYITQAGGHMPAEIKKRLLYKFPDKEIYIMYGATEASARLAYLEPGMLSQKLNSFGKAIPNVEIKIITKQGNNAGINEEGEIVARGSNIMKNYWNAPEQTKKVLKNGWYYTGDLGIMDEGGYFFVTGRKRDMIKVGIYKVSANEIEETLYKYPGITEAAVIGIPDDKLGEAVKAYIVTSEDADIKSDDITNYCSKNLSSHKIPKQIEFIKALPKNESGKILKRELSKSNIYH